MKQSSIRAFRRNLRRFERLNQLANTTCCGGITLAQCHILLEIENLSETTTKQLSENLWLDKSTLSRTIDGLKKQGFIKRYSSPRDRRFTILSLTRKGIDKCKTLNTYNDNLYIDVFKRFSPKDRNRFFQLFGEMVLAFSDYCRGRNLCRSNVQAECGKDCGN